MQQHDNEYAAVPVTPHIRTCLIGRMVRAFDPSGLEVNSAESDSAVGTGMVSRELTWAGEFVAGLSLAPFDRGEHIKQRSAIVP